MAEQEGYVKLNRSILHWKWVTSCTTGWLFVILLLKANYKEMEFKGVKIHPGQLVTSYQTLCESTGLTLQQCRTAINRLKSTGEITTKPYHNFQVITIINYKKYQYATGKSTSKQQASNRQTTSKQQQEKEYKEGKKERKKEEERFAPGIPLPCGASVKPEWMSDAEWENCKYKTADDIPSVDRGFYDTYIEFAEAEHRGGAK